MLHEIENKQMLLVFNKANVKKKKMGRVGNLCFGLTTKTENSQNFQEGKKITIFLNVSPRMMRGVKNNSDDNLFKLP